MKHLITLFALVLTLNYSFASGCLQYPVTLEERVENSQLIIEGEIIRTNSQWNDSMTMIETLYEIKPSVFYKGEAMETVTFKALGGTVGEDMMIVDPSIEAQVGDKGVFFLHNNTNNIYEVYALNQGAYKYDISSDKAVSVFDSFNLSNGKLDDAIQEISGEEIRIIDASLRQATTLSNTRLNVNISSFSPMTIEAGTSEELTINGSGFGSMGSKKVEFADANSGGRSFTQADNSLIVSWSDTKIVVKVPSRAGTGKVRITDSGNELARSSSNITVPFNRTSVMYGGHVRPTNLYNQNNQGGYTFKINTEFASNADALLRFEEGLAQWSCSTGINWKVGDLTTKTYTSRDGENTVSFVPSSQVAAGVLGVASSYFSGCRDSSPEGTQWYVAEVDVYFNKDINWNFATNNPASNQTDFYSVLLHELGHAHQFGHVIDRNSLMHYGISNGQAKRKLTPAETTGGNGVINQATQFSACGKTGMTTVSCNSFEASQVMDQDQCHDLELTNITKNRWNDLKTSTGELVIKFNPLNNDVTRLEVKPRFGSSDYLTTPSGSFYANIQYDFTAYDDAGNVMTFTEENPVRVVLPIRENYMERVIQQAGDIESITFAKSDLGCGETLTGSAPSIKLLSANSLYLINNIYLFEFEVTEFSSFFATDGSLGATPTPVTWGEFTVENQNENAVLNWSTITESNSSHFDVQRSQNGMDWETIHSEVAQGNSIEVVNYSFIDTDTKNGVNYYRLNQVDLDGQSEFSEIRTIEVAKQGNENIFQLTNNTLSVNGKDNSSVEIYNISGQIVNTTQNNSSLDLNQLPVGVYVAVYRDRTQTKTFKFSFNK